MRSTTISPPRRSAWNGNLISVIGGFLLASKGSIDYPLFIYTLVGVSLVVASGCVFNN
ncbi:hypothetical protein MJN51_34585, partial [Salmonella enterica subsp. enterica serovar Kentucky]|nr:hypothetical protein [Salmonella enterica subsp. enterica serovar Kentucky]